MVTSTFAQRVLMALAFLVLGTMVLLTVEMGLLGSSSQDWLRSQWLPIHQLYLANKQAADLGILVVGTSIPAVATGLAILRGFYYAELMLPQRLQELADSERQQHLLERKLLLGYVGAPFKTKDFLVPTIFANPFSKVLSLFGYVSTRNQAREVATTVGLLDGKIKTLLTKIEDLQNQKVAGH